VPPSRVEQRAAGLTVGNGRLGPPKGTITFQASEGKGVLEVLQLGRRDEHGSRNTMICEDDVFALRGSTSEVA
jgi:hypothetical protein